jgi:hypothetical protein
VPARGRAVGHERQDQGRAVQVDPIKPILKPPGTKRLKLECDILLLNYAFKFNLRGYMKEARKNFELDEAAPPRRD